MAWRPPHNGRPAVSAALPSVFAQAMERLGPFESRPSLAVAVSGGADSLALALLAADWARARSGDVLALIVDHALRPESGEEALQTIHRLTGQGISARLLRLDGLARGAALAERARLMRYEALAGACQAEGRLHLLLGHHASDQAETLAMRVLRGSRNDGLAGMAALTEMHAVRLLRPMLTVPPVALRRFLSERGVHWVEDPSNRDRSALRPRLRSGFAERSTSALVRAASSAGAVRAENDLRVAQVLARQVAIHPYGYALIDGDALYPPALAALVQTIGGNPYPPDPDRIAALGARLHPMTLGGTRLLPAGRLGSGWLLVREEAAIAPAVAAQPDLLWDNRFRLRLSPPPDATIGKLGDDGARFRDATPLPSAVLRTLPALRVGKVIAAVPHLGYGREKHDLMMTVYFAPLQPSAGPVFQPADASLDLPGCASPTLGEPYAGMGMQGG